MYFVSFSLITMICNNPFDKIQDSYDLTVSLAFTGYFVLTEVLFVGEPAITASDDEVRDLTLSDNDR